MRCGDNIHSVHKTKILEEAPDVTVAYCERCKERFCVRSGDKRGHARLFKREILQPHENLYFKEYPQRMRGVVTKA